VKFLFIVPELDRPSTLNRVLLFRPYLQSRGAEVDVVPCPKGDRERNSLFDRAAEFDVVILQKRMLRRGPFLRLRRRARRLVFDFDDAILYRGPDSRRPHSLSRWMRFRRIARNVDAVWASNRYLSGLAARFITDPGKIAVFPTVIHLRGWPPRDYGTDPGETVVLGWMGGEKNLLYLEDLRDVFEEVGRRHPGTVLRIVSRRFLELHGMRVDPVPWSPDREVRDIQSFDVGLAPLRDDLWTRGKNTLKILNYFGAALPVVASPVGINADIVRNGKTGFSPRTPEEWVEALCYLIQHPGKRRQFGFAGRRLVAEHYSLEALAPRLWEHLVRLAADQLPAA